MPPPSLSLDFCCHYYHIQLGFVNNLASCQPTVVGTAEAGRNDLREVAVREEAGMY